MLFKTKPEGSHEDTDHTVGAVHRVLTQNSASPAAPSSVPREDAPGRGTWGHSSPADGLCAALCSQGVSTGVLAGDRSTQQVTEPPTGVRAQSCAEPCLELAVPRAVLSPALSPTLSWQYLWVRRARMCSMEFMSSGISVSASSVPKHCSIWAISFTVRAKLSMACRDTGMAISLGVPTFLQPTRSARGALALGELGGMAMAHRENIP